MTTQQFITGEQFCRWLADMKSAGLATYDADCARLLERSTMGIVKMKKQGTDKVTALACQALLKGLDPYGKSCKSRE